MTLAALTTGNAISRAADSTKPRAWMEGLHWLGPRAPTAADLKGKVVVVEFWTFGCVNCRRTVPAMKRLSTIYGRTRDVALIGIHAPEFENERDEANVRREIARLGLEYPNAQDNDFRAWRAFGNRYWPALYVLDREGAVRKTHVGGLHVGTGGWNAMLATIESLRR